MDVKGKAIKLTGFCVRLLKVKLFTGLQSDCSNLRFSTTANQPQVPTYNRESKF